MNNGYSKFGRRKVLKASVGGAAVPFAFNNALARQDSLPVVEQRRGTWANPLDVDEMMELKQQAIDRHVERGGQAPDYFINAVPGFPDRAKLVDYVVGIRPNGVPTQHVGVADNPESVRPTHREADAKLREVRAKARGDR